MEITLLINIYQQEVSLSHLAREVDVQSSHPGSSPHGHEFGFLFSKNQNRCRGFPYRISFKKTFINKKYIFSTKIIFWVAEVL
jgi:hypothetical protein